MAKQHFDRSKQHVNIGTIGHVDVVLQSTPLTSNIKQRQDTMPTSTAQDTLTTSRT